MEGSIQAAGETGSARRLLARVLVAVLLLVLGQWDVLTAEVSSAFEKANAHYEKREYREAIKGYEALLEGERGSAAVHFNLGNAYFRNKQPGKAIEYYRKAERLAPRDPDIQANLAFTRDGIAGTVSIERPPIDRLLTYFTPNELAIHAIIWLWIFALLYSLGRWRPSLRPLLRRYTVLAGFIWAFSLVWAVSAEAYRNRETAIVTAREAIVRFGPLDESRTAYTAPEGSELRVIGEKDNWIQVSDRTGRTGWLTRSQAVVFPDKS